MYLSFFSCIIIIALVHHKFIKSHQLSLELQITALVLGLTQLLFIYTFAKTKEFGI